MSSDAKDQIDGLVQQILKLHDRQKAELKIPLDDFNDLYKISRTLTTILSASSASLGECRQDDPYAPIKPVIDANGNLMWCCEHNPPHCAK